MEKPENLHAIAGTPQSGRRYVLIVESGFHASDGVNPPPIFATH